MKELGIENLRKRLYKNLMTLINSLIFLASLVLTDKSRRI